MVAGGAPRRLRRLRRLRDALASAATAGAATLILHEEVELIPHDQPRQHTDSVGSYPRSERWTADGHRNFGSRGAGAPLLQDERGAVIPAELERLEKEKADAVAADDYRTAAAVQTIIQVVTPRVTPLPKPLAEYMVAPNFDDTDVRAAADFFLENGFCVVPGVVSEATLQRVRAGWPAAEAEARALWEARAAVSRGRWGLSWASGAPTGYRTFFDLGLQPEPGGEHWALARALVEVAAHPGLIQTGKLLLGGNARVLGFPGGRVVPPESEAFGPEPGTRGGDGGYTSWHRDSPPPDGWPTPHSRRIKAFCSFWDTPADGGATAVVPMSHRTPAGPKDTLSRKFTGGGFVHSERPPDGEGLPMASMTNHVPLALPAGVIFLIDQAVWHCALPNTSDNARRNVIMGLSGEGSAIKGAALHAAVEENIADGIFDVGQRECFGL